MTELTLQSQDTHRPPTTILMRGLTGLAAGLLAGALYWVMLTNQAMSPMMSPADVPGDFALHLFISAAVGVAFGLCLGGLVRTPGSGLVWGVVFGLVWWLVGPLTLFPFLHNARPQWTIEAAREAFPLLTGLAVSYGAALGLLYWFFSSLAGGRLDLSHLRALYARFALAAFVGGFAGLLGGLIYGAWIEQAGFFPLVADMMGGAAGENGYGLHLLISIAIGASYGVLCRQEITGLGSSIAWGATYGLLWWILGPLTLMPLLAGDGVQWTLEAGRAGFSLLIGHVIYGVILGISYSLLTRIGQALFIDSDPLKREPEGVGTRSLRAFALGITASIVGGLLFTIIMSSTDALPVVAQLIGMTSPAAGFIVHMIISAIIGATYGLLFRSEAFSYGTALAWGLVYGLMWWFLGPLTLMPLLLGVPVQWTLDAALALYPSLIGHLIYGGALSLAFLLLARRYDPAFRRLSSEGRSLFAGQPAGTPRSALWVILLVMGILLPLLLAP